MSKSVSDEIHIRREAFLNSNPVKYKEKTMKCDKGRVFWRCRGQNPVPVTGHAPAPTDYFAS
ncbi:hypothetical protein OkiPb00504_11750 [Escherichia coli]